MVRPAHLSHLARRFATALRRPSPSPADEGWARSWLTDREEALWDRMGGIDRFHAVAVARETVRRLPAADRPVVAAALLHDVGKVESGLGTFARAAVTAAALVVGHQRLSTRLGERRAGRYLRHAAIGGQLLSDAGSHPLTVAWAREHHLPAPTWTLPPQVAAALKAADDD